ncbi:MAG TPA: fibronectin type III domain-containing protein [Verrucomicrobiae bacterium]|nr:fibronectin type III domain-containing protein [Verrucomicrobiae bacterium]
MNARAAKVTLQWDASPDPSVVGYRVYVQQIGSVNASVIETGNTTVAMVDNLIEGKTYSIYMTAYDATRLESNPSNGITYSVPAIPAPVTSGFALQFGGFNHATAQYSPRGTMSAKGEVYPEGTRVTLSATADAGYACTGWTINGVVVAGNPGVVTMNQNTVVAPVLKKQGGGSRAEPPPTVISLKIGATADKPTISVGGELGAWVLEGSNALSGGWSQVAQGLTSEQVTITPSVPYAFYRVRSVTLAAF